MVAAKEQKSTETLTGAGEHSSYSNADAQLSLSMLHGVNRLTRSREVYQITRIDIPIEWNDPRQSQWAHERNVSEAPGQSSPQRVQI